MLYIVNVIQAKVAWSLLCPISFQHVSHHVLAKSYHVKPQNLGLCGWFGASFLAADRTSDLKGVQPSTFIGVVLRKPLRTCLFSMFPLTKTRSHLWTGPSVWFQTLTQQKKTVWVPSFLRVNDQQLLIMDLIIFLLPATKGLLSSLDGIQSGQQINTNLP